MLCDNGLEFESWICSEKTQQLEILALQKYIWFFANNTWFQGINWYILHVLNKIRLSKLIALCWQFVDNYSLEMVLLTEKPIRKVHSTWYKKWIIESKVETRLQVITFCKWWLAYNHSWVLVLPC